MANYGFASRAQDDLKRHAAESDINEYQRQVEALGQSAEDYYGSYKAGGSERQVRSYMQERAKTLQDIGNYWKSQSNDAELNTYLDRVSSILGDVSKGVQSSGQYYNQFRNATEEGYFRKYNNKSFSQLQDVLNTGTGLTDNEKTWLSDFAQQKGAFEYKQRTDGYQKKYAGMTYSDMMSAIRNGGLSDEESEWLRQYADSVATEDDYNNEIEVVKGLIQQNKDKYKSQVSWGETAADNIVGERASLDNELADLIRKQKALNAQNKYSDLENNADFAQYSVPSETEATAGFGIALGNKWHGSGDLVYDIVNNLGSARLDYTDTKIGQYALLDEPKMKTYKDRYNYIHNTQGEKAANEYLETISGILDDYKESVRSENREAFAMAHPILGAAEARMTNLASGVGLIDITLQNLRNEIVGMDKYRPVNYNTDAMAITRYGTTMDTVNSQRLADLSGVVNVDPETHPIVARLFNGKSLGDVYQFGMSMIDSRINAAMFGGFAEAAEIYNMPWLKYASTVTFFGSAGASKVLEAVDNGASDSQAIMLGLANGFFESYFEEKSLESIIHPNKNGVLNFLRNFGVEGSEELFTSGADDIAEIIIMADKSEIVRKYNEYLKEMPKDKALVKAATDVCVDLMWDFVGGGLMGGLSGAGQSAVNWGMNNYHNMQLADGVSAKTLIDNALEANPDNKLAKKLAAKFEGVNEADWDKVSVSGWDKGRLIGQTESALAKNDVETVKQAVSDRLTELGETGDVSKIAGVIADYVYDSYNGYGEETGIKKRNAAIIRDSVYGQRVLNELLSENGNFSSGWTEGIQTDKIYNVDNSGVNDLNYHYNDKTGKIDASGISTDQYIQYVNQYATQNAEAPSLEEILNASQMADEGKLDAVPVTYGSGSIYGSAIDRAISDYTKAQSVERAVQRVGNEVVNAGNVTERINENGDVINAETGEVIREAGSTPVRQDDYSLESLSKKYGKQSAAMVATYHAGQDPIRYDSAYENAYGMGKAGVSKDYVMKAESTSYLEPSQREIAYQTGVDAAKQTRDAKTESVSSKAKKNPSWKPGTVKADGIKLKDLNKTQKNAYKILSSVAQVTGMNIVLYSSETDANGNLIGENGRYESSKPNTVYIDINAGLMNISDAADLAKYTMVRTFTHEFTHFVENWNAEGYDALRTMVFDRIIEQGQKPEDLIQAKMMAEEGLSYENATREVVADAMTDILPESSFIEQLANEHQNLFQKLLEKFKEFVASIKAHFAELANNNSPEARLMKDEVNGALKYCDDIIKAFDAAAKGAVENMQSTNATSKKAEAATVEAKTETEKKNDTSADDEQLAKFDVMYNKLVRDGIEWGNPAAELVDDISKQEDPYAVKKYLDSKTPEELQAIWNALKMNYEQTDRIVYLENYVKAKGIDIVEDSGEEYSRTEYMQAWEYAKQEETLAEQGVIVDAESDSAVLTQNSVRTLLDPEQAAKAAKQLAKRFGVTEEYARNWIAQETSIASIILNPRYQAYLDFEADPNENSVKKNSDYKQGTLDFSSICKKRREFTKIMNDIMRRYPDHVFQSTDLAKIRSIMSEEGLTVACGLCYVEDRRQHDTRIANGFITALQNYRNGIKLREDGKPFSKKQDEALRAVRKSDYVPTVRELTTLEGMNELREKDRTFYNAWVKYNNARGMQSIRMLTNEAEYDRQFLDLTPAQVKFKNDLGGMRIYSFSDMEMFHLLDVVQAITDGSAVGLMFQGYTKVNEYAYAMRNTGLKLNRSLIPAGDLGYHIDKKGNVVLDYDTTEGIDINSKDFFDATDNPDIGNILIGINPTQIRQAMQEEFVTQIIPFHTGQSKDVLKEKGIGAWVNAKNSQTERVKATGNKTKKGVNFYTEVIQVLEKEGKEVNKWSFTEKFLEVCEKRGLTPRFDEYLNHDENGKPIYTEGYYKLLVDFKMFDQKTGKYLPQTVVRPDFDMDYILGYTDENGKKHQGILQRYVSEQKKSAKDIDKRIPTVVDRISKEIVEPAAEESNTVQKQIRDAFGVVSRGFNIDDSEYANSDDILSRKITGIALPVRNELLYNASQTGERLALTRYLSNEKHNDAYATVTIGTQEYIPASEWEARKAELKIPAGSMYEIGNASGMYYYPFYALDVVSEEHKVSRDINGYPRFTNKPLKYFVTDADDNGVFIVKEVIDLYTEGNKENKFLTRENLRYIYGMDDVELGQFTNKIDELTKGWPKYRKSAKGRVEIFEFYVTNGDGITYIYRGTVDGRMHGEVCEKAIYHDIVNEVTLQYEKQSEVDEAIHTGIKEFRDKLGGYDSLDDHSRQLQREGSSGYTGNLYGSETPNKARRSVDNQRSGGRTVTEETIDELLLELDIKSLEDLGITYEDLTKPISTSTSDLYDSVFGEDEEEAPPKKTTFVEGYVEDGNSARMKNERLEGFMHGETSKSRANYWVTSINPSTFLAMTLGEANQNRDRFDTMPGEYDSTVNDYDFIEGGLKTSRIAPYLNIDPETMQVVGHEGRHRMRALEKAGITNAEIAVQFFGNKSYNFKDGRVETLPSIEIINQCGTGQYTELRNIIPANMDHREELLSTYGENVAKKNDIQYQARVNLYNHLAKDPVKNATELKQIVRDVAGEKFKDSVVRDADGNLTEVYHGTSNAGFTSFDSDVFGKFGLMGRGNYFTENKSVASDYTTKGEGRKNGVYSVYLDIRNPLDMDADADIKKWISSYKKVAVGMYTSEGINREFADVKTNEDAFIAVKNLVEDLRVPRYEGEDMVMDTMTGMGYDGITHIGGGRYGGKDGPKHRVWITFSSTQQKSSEPVTYDSAYTQRDFDSMSEEELAEYASRVPELSDFRLVSEFERAFRINQSWGFVKDALKEANDYARGKELDTETKDYIARVNETLAWISMTTDMDELSKLTAELKDNIRSLNQASDEGMRFVSRLNGYGEHKIGSLLKEYKDAVDPNNAFVGRGRNISVDMMRYQLAANAEPYNPLGADRAQNAEAIIPVENRFDTDNTDIRFQQRTYTVSNRDILRMASDNLDRSEMTAEEIDALDAFNEKLAYLDAQVAERQQLGKLYHDQMFSKPQDKEGAEKTRERMKIYDERVRKASHDLLSLQNKDVLKRVLEQSRKVIERNDRAKFNDQLKRYRDKRLNAQEIKKYKDRIAKDVGDMSKWILNPSNKNAMNNVPAVLRKPVLDMLTSIDMTSHKLSNHKKHKGEVTQKDQRILRTVTKLKDVLSNVVTNPATVDELYSGYIDLPDNFIPQLNKTVDAMQTIADNFGKYEVANMTSDELKVLSEIVTTLKTSIQKTNRFLQNGFYSHIAEAGDATIAELDRYKSTTTNKLTDALLWQQIRPVYGWERFGEAGKAIFNGIVKGQEKLAFNAMEIEQFAEDTYTSKEAKEWSEKTITVKLSGNDVKMTIAQAMGLYELSKRKQGRQHILGGGVRIATFKDGKTKIADAGNHVAEGDLKALEDKLTPRQKEVADKMQKFMAEYGREKGNYVSVARFGVEQFTEPDYYPVASDGRLFSAKADEAPSAAALYAMLNMSFTKMLNPDADNRVVIYNIFDVFANHTSSMAQYNAFALPVLDTIKWLNYQQVEYDIDGTKIGVNGTVRDSMQKVFGSAEESARGTQASYAEKFVVNMIKSLNGTESQGDRYDGTGMKALHTFNMAQIAYNARVVVQQPMAITRAAMVLSPKSIAKAMTMPQNIKKNVEEACKKNGIAAWKIKLGYYDVNISTGMADKIRGTESFMDKVGNVGMAGAEFADNVTWGTLWGACKEEVISKQHLRPSDGQKFYDAVSDLFNDVIIKTQVVDSVMTKSEFMRSKGFFARSVSSFMSEPVTTASMLINAYDKFRMAKQAGMTNQQAWKLNGSLIARTAAVYAVSQILMAAVTAAFDTFRDDDEYETWTEKWQQAFNQNVIDELLPFNKLPIMSDFYDLAKTLLGKFGVDTYGFGPNTVYMQYYDNLAKGVEILSDKINGEDTNYTYYGMTYKLLQAASGITGLPLANVSRDVAFTWNTTIGSMAPSLRLKTYDAGPGYAVKSAFNGGTLSEDEAIAKLVETGVSEDANAAYWKVQGWKAGVDNFSKYSRLDEILVNGGDTKDAIAELTAHGVKEKTVLTHIKSKIGDMYRATDEDVADGAVRISRSQAESMLGKYLGLDKDEVHEITQSWTSFVDTGYNTNEYKEAFMDGEITRQQAIDWKVKYAGADAENAEKAVSNWEREKASGYEEKGDIEKSYLNGKITSQQARTAYSQWGYSSDEVDEQMELLDFKKSHKDAEDITYKQMQAYKEYGEGNGIPVDQFVSVLEFKSHTHADVDANGNAIQYSLMYKVIDYIDSLPLSTSQKDAMFLMNYAQSNLKYVSWR